MKDRLTVKGGDYTYEGYIDTVFKKRGGAVRCVVEDDKGRLFIHNAAQLGMSDEELLEIKDENQD